MGQLLISDRATADLIVNINYLRVDSWFDIYFLRFYHLRKSLILIHLIHYKRPENPQSLTSSGVGILEVNGFNYIKDAQFLYDKNGVTIQSCPVPYAINGLEGFILARISCFAKSPVSRSFLYDPDTG